MILKYLKQSFLIILFIFFICYNSNANSNAIVATIKPLHSLVQGVLGDTEKAGLIINNNSPHNPNLKPSKIKLISNAKIIFGIDETLEPFLKTINPNKKILMLQSSMINKLNCRNNCHKSNNTDVHIWLSTTNAQSMVKIIYSTLAIINPHREKIYDENTKKILKKIEDLDNKINSQLQAIKNKPFLVFHDAYQYFEKQYNLSSLGFIHQNPNTSLSIQHIKQIRKTINNNDKICIFSEPQFSKKITVLLSESTKNTKIGVLDPIGANLIPGENLYFDLLEDVSNNLLRCLL
ncbi:Zinc ABC transporter substrate-binding protein [Candidatus Xenohaliotis californiensis]|uniref:High-affinity zinc uptake system protein ZnuA n=1 Tax=Candidatus Xenohaliotis californiensis TaxID=84677 RepID=A0ABP0EWD9_9RICK|nr:Zinc ABC transporter substrate-binding protein [Candidatus Xenohaliotis californiensis]